MDRWQETSGSQGVGGGTDPRYSARRFDRSRRGEDASWGIESCCLSRGRERMGTSILGERRRMRTVPCWTAGYSGCLGQGLAGLLGRVDSIWTRGDEGATRIPDYSVNSRTLPPRPQCSLSRQRCSLNLKKKTLSFYLHCIKAGCDVRRVCVTSTRACQPKRRAKFCLSQEGATV